jgi:hypothetical protein
MEQACVQQVQKKLLGRTLGLKYTESKCTRFNVQQSKVAGALENRTGNKYTENSTFEIRLHLSSEFRTSLCGTCAREARRGEQD